MSKYEENEKLGRKLFLEFYERLGFSAPTFEENTFSRYDATTAEGLVEIKRREIPFQRYKDIVFEVDKARSIYSLSKERNTGAYYVMFFTDNIVAVVDVYKLTRENTNIVNKLAASSSCEDRGSRYKEMFLLKEDHIAVTIFRF